MDHTRACHFYFARFQTWVYGLPAPVCVSVTPVNLELELQSLADHVGRALVGIVDGHRVVVAIERVGPPVMVNDLAGLRIGLGERPVLAREELQWSLGGRWVLDLPRGSGQNPGANRVPGELRRLRAVVCRKQGGQPDDCGEGRRADDHGPWNQVLQHELAHRRGFLGEDSRSVAGRVRQVPADAPFPEPSQASGDRRMIGASSKARRTLRDWRARWPHGILNR